MNMEKGEQTADRGKKGPDQEEVRDLKVLHNHLNDFKKPGNGDKDQKPPEDEFLNMAENEHQGEPVALEFSKEPEPIDLDDLDKEDPFSGSSKNNKRSVEPSSEKDGSLKNISFQPENNSNEDEEADISIPDVAPESDDDQSKGSRSWQKARQADEKAREFMKKNSPLAKKEKDGEREKNKQRQEILKEENERWQRERMEKFKKAKQKESKKREQEDQKVLKDIKKRRDAVLSDPLQKEREEKEASERKIDIADIKRKKEKERLERLEKRIKEHAENKQKEEKKSKEKEVDISDLARRDPKQELSDYVNNLSQEPKDQQDKQLLEEIKNGNMDKLDDIRDIGAAEAKALVENLDKKTLVLEKASDISKDGLLVFLDAYNKGADKALVLISIRTIDGNENLNKDQLKILSDFPEDKIFLPDKIKRQVDSYKKEIGGLV